MSRTPAAAKQNIIVDRAGVREIKLKFWHYTRNSCVCAGRGGCMLLFVCVCVVKCNESDAIFGDAVYECLD